jgi:plasmid stabilization system protein ParE
MAVRQFQLTPEAEPILDSVAASFGGDASLALPDVVKRRAGRSIELLASQPRMYPVRRRGIMRGYRYFVAHGSSFITRFLL